MDAEKMIESMTEIRNDPDFHSGLNTISDIWKATFPKGFLETNMVVIFVKKAPFKEETSNWPLSLNSQLWKAQSCMNFYQEIVL